ncbi:MAG: hypothetical protein RL757_1970 [Bacteroidota bacterium]|jgi:serine/threonine-protein kinase RsbW
MRKGTSTILKLRSNAGNIQQIEHYVNKIAEQHRLAPDTYGNILISLTEAVNNAMIHGNKLDESKFVEVRTVLENGKLQFSIADQGCGFDPKSVPDPTTKENCSKCGGRGVFLMRKLADRCHFKDNGRTVEMDFKL